MSTETLGTTLSDVREEIRDDLPQIGLEQIVAAMRQGVVVNRDERDADGRLRASAIRTDEEASGAFLDTPVPTAQIEASVLRDALLRIGDESDPRGLRLHRVVVVGELDLNWLTLNVPVAFEGCFFDSIAVNHFTCRQLSFDTCHFAGALGIWGYGLQLEGSLRFFHCEGLRQLFLVDSKLGMFELADHSFLGGATAQPRVNITGSTFDVLTVSDDGDVPTVTLGTPGNLTFGRLDLYLAESVRPDAWLDRWLRPATSKAAPARHEPQVWQQFAAGLENAGEPQQAVRLRIAAERNRYRAAAHQAGFWGWAVRAGSFFLDATTGYFYRNLRALVWLAACWIAIIAVTLAAFPDLYASSASTASAASLGLAERVGWSAVYAANIVIVPLDLGFNPVWPSEIGLVAVFGILKLLSIVLFGLFLAGVTGLINRR
ncbi:hypothetical protein E1I21_03770 [Microbacterium oleivorans]|uniref:hypothetical protein n=1 Tax=Microbacterium oleivorans TaxID=273677 RepID=UPI0010A2F66A|nr:hypothetical protein [Microbacterium oleivorans]THE08265.1 hypothetical protein E1I21_03770 [Microbacterium oleivorans]